MPVFPIKSLQFYQGSSAAIKRPKEIAFFSYDDEHKYRADGSSLRYYWPPRIGADLCTGFDTFQKLDDTADSHIDSLLRTLQLHEERTGAKCEADFVTWRGMMTKIMNVPGDNMSGSGFEMNATLFQGTIFIEENHAYKLAQQATQRQQPGPMSQDLMSYWGYKFETLSLLPEPWDACSRDYIEGRESQVVNNHAQYCSIVRTAIGAASLVLAGEVDGVWDAKPAGGPVNWIELKTSACINSDKDALKYERKLKKFWIQSFLLGVPKIIVGFRDQQGVLRGIEELETAKIPTAIKNGRRAWDGNVCINFTAAFLQWLKEAITDEDCVYRVQRKDQSQVIEVFKVEERGHGRILTQDFLDWRRKQCPWTS